MASDKIVLKCQSKCSKCTLDNLSPKDFVGDLKILLTSSLDVDITKMRVLHGYPPCILDLSNDEQRLSDLPIKSGDTLIIDDDNNARSGRTFPPSRIPTATVSPIVQRKSHEYDNVIRNVEQQLTEQIVLDVLPEGLLLQYIMPANNSCLFASVYFAETKTTLPDYLLLREVVATAVAADPVTYNEGFLGKSNQEYCKWIRQNDHWGGAIELSILCKHYGFEIVVIDQLNSNLLHFGEDCRFDQRIFLVYSGVHYDVVALKPTDPHSELQTVFPVSNEVVLQKANELIMKSKIEEPNQSCINSQATGFICSICKEVFYNKTKMSDHASKTDHADFQEV